MSGRVEAVTDTILPCETCGGDGWYQYTTRGTPHSTVCSACCRHNKGWWMLKEHYGESNGRWCCLRGCGHTISEEEYRALQAVSLVSDYINGRKPVWRSEEQTQ